MTPDDLINTKPEPEPQPEETPEVLAEEPVKRKRRKKSFFERFDFTSLVDYDTIVSNMSFIVFIAAIMLVYIWNNHYAQRSINTISKNDKQLKELKWEYIYSKSELECKSQQTQVSKMMSTTGIKEIKNPPVKIYLTADGKN